MTYKYFIGVDVSKNHLDFAVIIDGELICTKRTGNNLTEIRLWLKVVRIEYKINFPRALFCCESTGNYHLRLLSVLKNRSSSVCVESPLRLKRSIGLQRGKNDKVDSIRIAEYAYRNSDKLLTWHEPRHVILQLRHLRTVIKNLQACILRLKQSKENQGFELPKKLLKQVVVLYTPSVDTLEKDLLQTRNLIIQTIKADDRLSRIFEILVSISGIGNVVAVELIIHTNEFKNFSNAKRFACFCGVAPFEKSSGIAVDGKKRTSPFSHRGLKTLFFLPAISATRSKGDIRDYYLRKVAEGRSKMSVINAVKNKLIHRIFACIRDNRLYEKTYKPSGIPVLNEK